MRKSASFILLVVLLFNMVGYRVWFHYAEMRSDATMEARLDNAQYEDKELISITVPLDNPYLLDQRSFERVDGEISLDGKTFKYVKRKVEGGKLILLCIPDAHKTFLKKAKAEYGQEANNLAGNSKSPAKSGLQKVFSGTDYISTLFSESKYKFENHTSITFVRFSESLASLALSSPGQPPKC